MRRDYLGTQRTLQHRHSDRVYQYPLGYRDYSFLHPPISSANC